MMTERKEEGKMARLKEKAVVFLAFVFCQKNLADVRRRMLIDKNPCCTVSINWINDGVMPMAAASVFM
jgi:hypothetical protein